MWTDDKQRRLDDLQQRAQHRSLSADDQQMLDQLLSELEQVEWAALRPALSRLRDEQGQLQDDLGRLQAQNAVLAALAERYADLLARAKVQLAGLVSEREALRAEYERALQ